MSNLISAVAWVKRGTAAQHPTKYALDEAELARVSALAREELEDARLGLEDVRKAAAGMSVSKENRGEEGDCDSEWEDESEGAQSAGDTEAHEDSMDLDEESKPQNHASAGKIEDAEDLTKYNLDRYDEDDAGGTAAGPFSNIKGLTFYRDNEDDPYITMKDDVDDDEKEELEVLPTDNLLVVGMTSDEVSQLEVYVYDESQDNLYVHHDLMLPSFPLCLEWLDFAPGGSSSSAAGNYVAVGTFDPEIEVWSLDTIDALYPSTILGRPDKTREHVPVPLGTGKKKKKKTKARETQEGWHTDAVLGLSWNRRHRNLLASASADKTVKLWDLQRAAAITSEDVAMDGNGEPAGLSLQENPAIRSFDVHSDKVQCVEWNTSEGSEGTSLLTGSYDRTVRVWDTRTPTDGVGAQVGADVEGLRWDPWDAHGFYVSLSNGLVLNFDTRMLSSSLASISQARFTVSAHDGAVSGLDINPHIPGVIATGGTDGLVKIWNVEQSSQDSRDIGMVISRDLGVGKVFTLSWSPDDVLSLAAGGSKARLQIWDVSQNSGARGTFKTKIARTGRELREKREGAAAGGLVGLADDEGSEE